MALILPFLIAIKESKIKPTRDEIEIQRISLLLSIHSVFLLQKAITSLTINLTGIISWFNKYHYFLHRFFKNTFFFLRYNNRVDIFYKISLTLVIWLF